jgi:hypothetical protein
LPFNKRRLLFDNRCFSFGKGEFPSPKPRLSFDVFGLSFDKRRLSDSFLGQKG